MVQAYIAKPLLVDGRKFDFRVYVAVASTSPLLVLYHKGFARVAMQPYEAVSQGLAKEVHLTNNAVAKTKVGWKADDLAWSYERVTEDLARSGLAGGRDVPAWLRERVEPRMKEGILHVVRAFRSEILPGCHGEFGLFGFDFMLDTDLNLWFLEANNPGLNREGVKFDLVPPMISSLLDFQFERVAQLRAGSQDGFDHLGRKLAVKGEWEVVLDER